MSPSKYFRLFQDQYSSSLFFCLLKQLSQTTTWVERKAHGHYVILEEEKVMDYLQSYTSKHKNFYIFTEEECDCCPRCCCKRSF